MIRGLYCGRQSSTELQQPCQPADYKPCQETDGFTSFPLLSKSMSRLLPPPEAGHLLGGNGSVAAATETPDWRSRY